MRRVFRSFIILSAIPLILVSSAVAAPGTVPAGYILTNASSGLSSGSLSQIGQMVFKPGDPTHLFATRTFQNVVTRYDYNATTGQLSNPINVVNLAGIADGKNVAQGIGFHGNDLWLTRWSSASGAAISRLRDSNYGIFETRADFVTGITLGQHEINQVQIYGNSLFTSIGTKSNTGTSGESVYNGTVDRIGDLNAITTTDLSTAGDLTAFTQSNISDGKLRRYASGMRNPYGIRVTSAGVVWVTDNGQDPASGGVLASPDYVYRNLQPGNVGKFPVGNPSATISDFSNLGERVGSAGFDFFSRGPNKGDLLVALASTTGGHKLARVNGTSGGVPADFITGFNLATDVVADPFGRLLVSDFSDNAIYLLSTTADTNLDRRVDVTDLLAMAQHWQTSSNWAGGDFDGSGFVDIADARILAKNWTSKSNPALAPILTQLGLTGLLPEPGSISVIVAAVLFLSQSRYRNPR